MDLNTITKVLTEAASLPPSNKNGMLISLPGVLSHGARALREMAEPLENATEIVAQEFDDRLMEEQPSLHAYGLEELGKHIAMLKEAFRTGDAMTVRQFFDLYVFY